jgi:hypothetical protein
MIFRIGIMQELKEKIEDLKVRVSSALVRL